MPLTVAERCQRWRDAHPGRNRECKQRYNNSPKGVLSCQRSITNRKLRSLGCLTQPITPS